MIEQQKQCVEISSVVTDITFVINGWTHWDSLSRPVFSYHIEPVWSILMSRIFPRSCYGVSYAIKNQLVASKAPY